jgi:protocatechuate 3,4-dioxygenase beta subunit
VTTFRRIAVPAIVLVALAILVWHWRRSAHDGGRATGTHASRAGNAASLANDRRPDPHAAPRSSIAGTVTDEHGTPIAHARVCVDAISADLPAQDVRDPKCVDTDARGGYAIDGLLAAHYEVTAMARAYRPAVYHPAGEGTGFAVAAGEHRTGIDLVLRAGGVEITGTVSDVGGGPIAHARVRAMIGATRRAWGAAVETDDQGRFSLWTDPGDTSVQGIADGYGPDTEAVHAPGTIALYLTPESSLSGTVVDAATGDPVEGARVELEPGLDDLSDAQGHFRIGRLAPGRYLATARTAHRYGHADGSTLVGLGQHVDGVTIRVFPAVQLRGKVVIGDAATPCAGADVSITDAGHRRAAHATSEEGGTVALDGVLPGTYTVRVACRGYRAHDHYDPIVVADRDLDGLVWRVDPGATLRGRVLTTHGEPVEDAAIRASLVTAARQAGDIEDTRSGKDGAYELTGLATGTYKLAVTSDRGVAPRDGYSVDLTSATVTKDLVLDDSATIRGTVVDTQGTPVPDVDVFADPHGAHAYGDHRKSQTDGSFVIDGLRPGGYRVVARRDYDDLRKPGTNDDAEQGERVTVAAGQTASVRLVVEPQTGRITGTVVDADNKPVPDAYVSAARESDAAGAPISSVRDTRWGDDQPALTTPEGKFTLGPFGSGLYTLRAYRKGGGEAIAEHVAVGATATLQIKPTGSISGTVSRSDGSPPDELDIIIDDPKTAFTRREQFYRTAGAFAIRDLPAGAFVLTAIASGARKQLDVPLAEGEHKTGITLTLDSTVTITGRVVEMTTHQPVAGLRMSARAATLGSIDSSTSGDSVTDEAGRFSLSDVPTGRVWIFGVPPEPNGWTTLQAVRTVTGSGTVDVGDLPILHSRLKHPGDQHGYLGLHFEPLQPGITPDQRQVKVSWIDPNGPAAHLDIRVGDVLESVDGVNIQGDNYGFTNPMLIAPIGTTVKITLVRGVTILLTLGTPP